MSRLNSTPEARGIVINIMTMDIELQLENLGNQRNRLRETVNKHYETLRNIAYEGFSRGLDHNEVSASAGIHRNTSWKWYKLWEEGYKGDLKSLKTVRQIHNDLADCSEQVIKTNAEYEQANSALRNMVITAYDAGASKKRIKRLANIHHKTVRSWIGDPVAWNTYRKNTTQLLCSP